MAFNLNIKRKEGITKCVRFPAELLKEIEDYIAKNEATFSRFVIEACKYALEDIKTQEKKKIKN